MGRTTAAKEGGEAIMSTRSSGLVKRMRCADLDKQQGHRLLQARIISCATVDGLGHELEHEVQKDLVLTGGGPLNRSRRVRNLCALALARTFTTDLVTLGVEEACELHDVWVADQSHNIQLSVLCASPAWHKHVLVNFFRFLR